MLTKSTQTKPMMNWIALIRQMDTHTIASTAVDVLHQAITRVSALG
jgi:hypothetical protein